MKAGVAGAETHRMQNQRPGGEQVMEGFVSQAREFV